MVQEALKSVALDTVHSLSTMENKTKGRLLLRASDKGRSLQTLGKILRVMEIRRISTVISYSTTKRGSSLELMYCD